MAVLWLSFLIWGNSIKVCVSGGFSRTHSSLVVGRELSSHPLKCLCFRMESSIIIMKNKMLVAVTSDPIELIVFHVMKLSWKSAYRRGNPASPKKCCGKKVKFTPTKVVQK